MNLLLNVGLFLTLTQLVQCLPFPFELGGDREEEDIDYPPVRPQRQWGYFPPSSRNMRMSPSSMMMSQSPMMMPPPSMMMSQPPTYDVPTSYRQPMRSMRRTPFSRRPFGGRFGSGRTAQGGKDDDEDEKNREKVEQALQAQQTIIDTVLPIVNSIAPSTAGFLGMMPRMRRSHGSTAEDAPDQLSMPSEQTVSVLMPFKEQVESAEAVAPSVVVPINYQQAAMLVANAQQRSTMDALMGGKDESEAEDKSDDGDDEMETEDSAGKEAMERLNQGLSGLSLMALPQVIPPSFLPRAPDATVTTGDDDKIYFAVDRKTILSFLGALFGNDLRSAMAAAVHENSVHKP